VRRLLIIVCIAVLVGLFISGLFLKVHGQDRVSDPPANAH